MGSGDARDDWGFDREPEVAPQAIPRRVVPKAARVSETVGRETSDRASLAHTLATAAIVLLLVTWLAVIALSAWWLVARISG